MEVIIPEDLFLNIGLIKAPLLSYQWFRVSIRIIVECRVQRNEHARAKRCAHVRDGLSIAGLGVSVELEQRGDERHPHYAGLYVG